MYELLLVITMTLVFNEDPEDINMNLPHKEIVMYSSANKPSNDILMSCVKAAEDIELTFSEDFGLGDEKAYIEYEGYCALKKSTTPSEYKP